MAKIAPSVPLIFEQLVFARSGAAGVVPGSPGLFELSAGCGLSAGFKLFVVGLFTGFGLLVELKMAAGFPVVLDVAAAGEVTEEAGVATPWFTELRIGMIGFS